MTVPMTAAVAAFLMSLGGALWLSRTRHERVGFAALASSPVIGAMVFAAVAALPQRMPGDADAWADLGDGSAAAAGGDLRAGREAIGLALAIDPNHPKALWLEASLELQEQRYGEAAEHWQRLLSVLAADSDDARIVRANLEETRALAARTGAER